MVIKNIVLSGGQIKGISYIGILRALEDLDLLNNIENILGVSSGAIMSFAIALGLSSKQIEKILDVLTLDNLEILVQIIYLNLMRLMVLIPVIAFAKYLK